MEISDPAAVYFLLAILGGAGLLYISTFLIFTRRIERLVSQSQALPPRTTPNSGSSHPPHAKRGTNQLRSSHVAPVAIVHSSQRPQQTTV